MARLMGIVNPQADKADYFNYWLWRPNPAIPWDASQLNIEKMDVDGNIQFRVLGPHTPIVPDGVFAKIQFNPALNPTAYFGETAEPIPPAPDPGGTIEIIDPNAPVIPAAEAPAQMAPAHNINVATDERLAGETKAQHVRRKAIALRWQASKLDKLAEDMEALEAQGLI